MRNSPVKRRTAKRIFYATTLACQETYTAELDVSALLCYADRAKRRLTKAERVSAEALHGWLGFNQVRGVRWTHLRALLERYQTLEAAWRAPAEALRAAGLTKQALEALLRVRQTYDPEAALRQLKRLGVRLLPITDPDYPPLLRQIADPPPLLYVRGTLQAADQNALAVVGTRNATEYGKRMTAHIVEPLASQGVTIISGLAHGIDSAAHRAALRAGGRTIAVLPCGIDRVYPADQSALAAQIMESGCLISEFPLGTKAERHNFPQRNRVISGLAYGVLVVEAAEKSGALITVDCALEQGREVFAVPGNALSPASSGTNALIRSGATLTTSAADILQVLAPSTPAAMKPSQVQPVRYTPESDDEACVLRYLEVDQAKHIDEIVRQSGLAASRVSAVLTVLEVKGVVCQTGAQRYSLVAAV
ncbi:MAG: DNA-processing protein DprA [Chloroflexi bacterium]|nr:DNA-processing protein DprA [Chloroflexota bacterium]